MHHVKATGEPAGADVVQHGTTDPLTVAAHASHHHAAGVEQRMQGPRLRPPVARISHCLHAGRHSRVQSHVGDVDVHLASQGESGIRKYVEHGAVLQQHLRDERGDAESTGRCREVFEQEAANAQAMAAVLDEERHLGGVGAHRLCGGHRQDSALLLEDQGQRAVAHEVVDVLVSSGTTDCEEAPPQGLVGDALVQLVQLHDVVGPQWADQRDGPVREEYVGREDVTVQGLAHLSGACPQARARPRSHGRVHRHPVRGPSPLHRPIRDLRRTVSGLAAVSPLLALRCHGGDTEEES